MSRLMDRIAVDDCAMSGALLDRHAVDFFEAGEPGS